ncbi:GroES-like protein [Aspergillus pseudoustus]|uniref:GroES-like protein n=1 Tax=Aspergillus pseudoustus TaxID=1810923 RepID=A0ABR4JMA9_9EURO
MAIPKTMKALRLVEYGEPYQLHEIPIPFIGDNDLLIKVGAAGFCHTDYQVYQGTYNSPFPMTPSHEPAGTVVSVGKTAAASGGWKAGQRIGMLNFRHGCKGCVGCRVNKQGSTPPDIRFCENKNMAGVTADGGFAEYAVADADTTVLLPDGLEFEQAAPLMCAGATVWGGLDAAGVERGLPIGIIGIGGLGSLAVQFAVGRGHPTVAIDNRPEGIQLAQEVPEHLRPEKVVNSTSANALQEIVDFAGDGGLAAVIVCTDNVQVTEWSLKLLRPRGVCVPLGLPEEGFRFSAFDLVFKELRVKGSLVCTQPQAAEMMQFVAENGVRSHVTTVGLEEAISLPDRYMDPHLKGRLVMTV